MSNLNEPVSVRKSGRQRQPNRKYFNEVTTLDILSSASEEETQTWRRLSPSDDDDDEFDATQVAEELNNAEEDVVSSVDAASEGSGIATPQEDLDDAASYASADVPQPREDGPLPPRRTMDSAGLYKRRKRPKDGTHSRGVAETVAPQAKGSKADYLYSLVGNAPQDLLHMARSRDQWCEDVAVPSNPNSDGSKGMRHFFSHTKEKRQMEATEGWDWYYVHGGQQHFEEVQRSHPLSATEAVAYIPQPAQKERTVFMGPYGMQSRFDLPTFQSIALDQAWKQSLRTGDSAEAEPEKPRDQDRRNGWMFNVGTGVRCLEWAPNQSGDTQYLAISTLQPKNTEQIGRLKFSPAFTPQSFPSSIQLWSFSSATVSNRESLLDSDLPPRLRMVICTDWGDAKHLRWCPMPRTFRYSDYDNKKTPIGLLAGVWSDGHVRVLDIHLPPNPGQGISYVKCTTAAFSAKPPSTLCTCVTWLSPTDLAVGCANGYLALWSIYPHPSSALPPPPPPQPLSSSSPPSSPPPPAPNLYTPIHPTYILSLATAYPLLPHYLATASASGHLRLTSLLNPRTDHVLSPRMRNAPSQLHFSEPCNAFLTVDDNDSLRAWPLRRFFSPVNIARLPSSGACLATGNFHPCVMVGCADGTACAVNPLRKLLFPKATSWRLPVFKHEVRRARESDSGEEEEEEEEEPGMKVRITEGYRMQEAKMAQGCKRGTGKAVEGVVVATVWEEEGHVRAVGWGKGGVGVGGWVAVGMGSGLVRVQDLGIPAAAAAAAAEEEEEV
ncbi:MAG: hypothetical protein Q9219_001934 [cf. Caloplaca sp. 3 TL-2023]